MGLSRPQFPKLTTLSIGEEDTDEELPAPYFDALTQLIADSALTLESLCLCIARHPADSPPGDIKRCMKSIIGLGFPKLRDLLIAGGDVLALPCFSVTPRVRILQCIETYDEEIPRNAFPAVEDLSCDFKIAALIFADPDAPARPVRYLILEGGRWPMWKDELNTIVRGCSDSVEVIHLEVDEIHLPDALVGLGNYVHSVAKLVIRNRERMMWIENVG